MLILVIGFGLLTDYIISNTNKSTAEGTSGPFKLPKLPTLDPEPEPSDNEDEDNDRDTGKIYCFRPPCDDFDDKNNNDDDNRDDDDNDNDNEERDKVEKPVPQRQPQMAIPESNTPPIAINSSGVTTQNSPINIPLQIYDNEGDMIDIAVVEPPKSGNLVIMDINTKTLTYTPHSNYIGYDDFTFQGYDRKAYSNNATVSIIIANLPPELASPGSLGSSSQPPVNNPPVSTNTQSLNNLNQVQLVDLIASEISNANNIDNNKVIQAVNDLSESTKANGGNVIESLKKIAGTVLNDPTGNVANIIIKIANQQ